MTIAICIYTVLVVIATMILLQAVYMAGKKRGRNEMLEPYMMAKYDLHVLRSKLKEMGIEVEA